MRATITSIKPLILGSTLLAALLIFATGCDGILDVNNPNNLIEEELNDPTAATALANGAEASVTRALNAIYAPYHTATDELTWIGSRDAWQELNRGDIDNPLNEFTDAAFPYVGEARWMADQTINRLEEFRDEGLLTEPIALARGYLYSAIIYITIADMFDDFALSDRREAAPPIGRENMDQLYDTAIDYLSSGLQIAEAEGASSWVTILTAMRARAHQSKALWSKTTPNVDTANPLVSDAQAVADAEAAITLMGGGDFFYELEMLPGLPVGDLSMALQVNSRLEMRISDEYIRPQDDGTLFEEVILLDPIDEVPEPFLVDFITEFTNAVQYADMIITSKREMHLIIAEDALANDDLETFEEHINAIRSLDGLSPYEGQIPALEMLQHARRVHLFLQGRRLIDHYRFDQPSAEWASGSTAMSNPGTLFPITITEVRANPNL